MLEVRSPATGELLATVAPDDDDALRTAVERARAAWPAWWRAGLDARVAAVTGFCERLRDSAEDSARLLSSETGKPIREARAEVAAVPERIDWFLDRVPEVLEPVTVSRGDDRVERVTVEPRGVVAHVSAWNYPWFVALNTVVPALLCGNAVVYKPSEHATLTGARLARLFHDAGVPADVLRVVVGPGRTGATLVTAEVDHVAFTGSHRTGVSVAEAIASRLVPCTLELGGKDPAYVCDDVDLAAVVPAVVSGAFYNAGQSCCAIERLYVHDAVFDELVAAFVARVEALRVGDPAAEATDVGPLTRPDQVEVLDAQIADALAKGARVLTGGARVRSGRWFAPTVLVDVDHTMAVMRDETFGPVVGIQRVAGDDDARALMDDTDYGLTAAVFTPDRGRAERILADLDVGSVYWNTADRTTSRLPWAGRRHSGIGASLGMAGIRALVRERAWHLFSRP